MRIEEWRYVVYVSLIILMMWVRPQGLAGASGSMLVGSRIKKTKKKQEITVSIPKEA